MKRLLHSTIFRTPLLAVALGAVGLSGCTSLRGTQESALFSSMAALKADSKLEDDQEYTRSSILDKYVDLEDDPELQKQYRNKTVAVFMDAIDENFHIYSSRLFNEGLQFGLGLEGSIVGLAATAALFPNSAPELASVIAAAGGAQATINKNLYFDRTLPALITTMDARRIGIESEIMGKLKRSVADYPMEAALRDLRRYQNTGTLFRAVADVTSNAAEDKKAAEEKYEAELQLSCDAQSANRVLTQRIGSYNNYLVQAVNAKDAGSPGAERKMRIIAEALELSSTRDDISDVNQANMSKINAEFCSAEELEGLIKKIEMITGDTL